MSDALISPAVGGTMWAVSGMLIAFCARKVKQSLRDNLVPMMGVLGAFIFASQMINFTIPGTGSSGHLGGGLILTVLLGPCAAFLVIASVLTVQAFFFADGGLLALGCNMFNLGFFPAFVAYPIIYRAIIKDRHDTCRSWVAAIVAAVVGLQLGAFSVVLETRASGISELPLGTFVLMMLPIHIAIGVVEGLVTAAVVSFVARSRPEALQTAPLSGASISTRPVLIGLAVAAVFLGGVVSWFASTHPDGLEWAIARVTGNAEESSAGTGANMPSHEGAYVRQKPATVGVRRSLAELQKRTAVLPGYGLKATGAKAVPAENIAPVPEHWPEVDTGTSLAGIVGGLMTLALACLVGLALKVRSIGSHGDR